MGFLNALAQSFGRFEDKVLPPGYALRKVTWIINIDPKNIEHSSVIKKGRGEWMVVPETPSDRRSSKISSSLIVDKVSYVTGRPKNEKSLQQSINEHNAYLHLLKQCFQETREEQLELIHDYFCKCTPYIPEAKPGDICALQIGSEPWPTDSKKIQKFWFDYLSNRLGETVCQCVLCGEERQTARILPYQVKVSGKLCPVFSVNTKERTAFGSFGKEQLGNSPVCFECAGKVDRTLKFLIQLDENRSIGRHAVILSRDDSKGKQPLRNQIAIFWTKKPVEVKSDKEEQVLLEDLVKKPFESFEELQEREAPVAAAQCRKLLQAPFSGGRDALALPDNRFYLAVLSPNKSRLVVREWLEMDIRPVKDNLKKYINAVQIIHPEGLGVWWPPVGGILEALRSYTSVMQKSTEGPRIAALGPDIIRKLIRCMYQGTPPPDALLVRALRCFRVPDPSTEDSGLGREQYKRQLLRRMSMASAMKLILTHGNEEESKAMEQLVTDYDKSSSYKKGAAYNCGRLLAVLEAIQRRASSSSRGVNTTLVDRFYGAASTAPATVFANLLSMATKAHLPKLRRDGKELFKVRSKEELLNIGDLLAEICRIIDDAGGFPPPLDPKEQAVFALGFYHQRADLKPTKKK